LHHNTKTIECPERANNFLSNIGTEDTAVSTLFMEFDDNGFTAEISSDIIECKVVAKEEEAVVVVAADEYSVLVLGSVMGSNRRQVPISREESMQRDEIIVKKCNKIVVRMNE
jgi:hypothetical protein